MIKGHGAAAYAFIAAAAFAVSMLAVRILIGFIRSHSFEGFGWYRIALGIILIVWMLLGK